MRDLMKKQGEAPPVLVKGVTGKGSSCPPSKSRKEKKNRADNSPQREEAISQRGGKLFIHRLQKDTSPSTKKERHKVIQNTLHSSEGDQWLKKKKKKNKKKKKKKKKNKKNKKKKNHATAPEEEKSAFVEGFLTKASGKTGRKRPIGTQPHQEGQRTQEGKKSRKRCRWWVIIEGDQHLKIKNTQFPPRKKEGGGVLTIHQICETYAGG